MSANLYIHGPADSRSQKETDEINKAMQYDSTLLRMCKETVAGLMRCVLCGSLGTHCVAFAGQILAHTPLPHADLQTMVLAFISCVSLHDCFLCQSVHLYAQHNFRDCCN